MALRNWDLVISRILINYMMKFRPIHLLPAFLLVLILVQCNTGEKGTGTSNSGILAVVNSDSNLLCYVGKSVYGRTALSGRRYVYARCRIFNLGSDLASDFASDNGHGKLGGLVLSIFTI